MIFSSRQKNKHNTMKTYFRFLIGQGIGWHFLW